MQTITPGFYYHYKHDPSGAINNYAYEVLNIAHHTEIDGLEESAMVVYQPLYSTAAVYQEGKHWDVRPLAMFAETVEKNGVTMNRFTRITDETVLEKLNRIRNEMYF